MPRRTRQPPSTAHPLPSAASTPDIDALYGLGPGFEPGRESGETVGPAAVFHTVRCPFCGEPFDTLIDASAGGACYIEDCQICCQPIEFELRVDARGAFAGITVRRA
jgi:Cysteine-rich CPXCG